MKSFRKQLRNVSDRVVYTEIFSLFASWEDIELCHKTHLMMRDLDDDLPGYNRYGFQERVIDQSVSGENVFKDLLLRDYDALWHAQTLRTKDLVLVLDFIKRTLDVPLVNIEDAMTRASGFMRMIVVIPPDVYGQYATHPFGIDAFVSYRNDLILAHTLPIRACYREMSRTWTSFLDDHLCLLLSDTVECETPLRVFVGRLWFLSYLTLSIVTEKSMLRYVEKWQRPEFTESHKCAAKFVASLKGHISNDQSLL